MTLTPGRVELRPDFAGQGAAPFETPLQVASGRILTQYWRLRVAREMFSLKLGRSVLNGRLCFWVPLSDLSVGVSYYVLRRAVRTFGLCPYLICHREVYVDIFDGRAYMFCVLINNDSLFRDYL
jgi:hypothetical protein